MLDESVTNLKLLATSGFEGEKEKHVEMVEVAAARIQLVRDCLGDPSLVLPDEELPALNTLTISTGAETSSPTVALDTTPVVMSSSAVEETRTALSSPDSGKGASPPELPPNAPQIEQVIDEADDKMDTDLQEDLHEEDTLPPLKSEISDSPPPPITTVLPDTPPLPPQIEKRPNGPIPTRSTLAQSSFAWMLEPDTTSSSLRRPSTSSSSSTILSGRPPSSSGGSTSGHKKRYNPSRERNAFLFGEVTADGAGDGSFSADHIFGLQPIRKGGG
jgi:TBC1 domain family protein 5